jgi:hypothetical protein
LIAPGSHETSLPVLAAAGIVHSGRRARGSRFELNPDLIARLKNYLDRVSEQWDQALSRLKWFVKD